MLRNIIKLDIIYIYKRGKRREGEKQFIYLYIYFDIKVSLKANSRLTIHRIYEI